MLFKVVRIECINPRHFTIDPIKGEDMYVGLLDKDLIEHYKIERETGKIKLHGHCESPNRPGYIGFLDLQLEI